MTYIPLGENASKPEVLLPPERCPCCRFAHGDHDWGCDVLVRVEAEDFPKRVSDPVATAVNESWRWSVVFGDPWCALAVHWRAVAEEVLWQQEVSL